MRKILTLTCVLASVLLTSCSSSEEENVSNVYSAKESSLKDSYIKRNLPKVLELDNNEILEFKDFMIFEENDILVSWNQPLLKKAYPKDSEYQTVLKNLVYLSTGFELQTEHIGVIDAGDFGIGQNTIVYHDMAKYNGRCSVYRKHSKCTEKVKI